MIGADCDAASPGGTSLAIGFSIYQFMIGVCIARCEEHGTIVLCIYLGPLEIEITKRPR